ncbi:hypothetical protein EYC80_004903 [Monilinia laxa]|uniref:Uncharacterized protein n=1 Tax=Monilinia laxa TaxID=61186 RepID=A0A5N6KJX0_MONLA|nr:hypothetical protein EYC80_004903 [Monilinia laxa]
MQPIGGLGTLTEEMIDLVTIMVDIVEDPYPSSLINKAISDRNQHQRRLSWVILHPESIGYSGIVAARHSYRVFVGALLYNGVLSSTEIRTPISLLQVPEIGPSQADQQIGCRWVLLKSHTSTERRRAREEIQAGKKKGS